MRVWLPIWIRCFGTVECFFGSGLSSRARLGKDRSKRPQLRKQKWLLRNSTIFRCAKNSDSNSARRKPHFCLLR